MERRPKGVRFVAALTVQASPGFLAGVIECRGGGIICESRALPAVVVPARGMGSGETVIVAVIHESPLPLQRRTRPGSDGNKCDCYSTLPQLYGCNAVVAMKYPYRSWPMATV